MRGINRVTLIGNLGSDPEIRCMVAEDAVVNFSIYVNESWKDKETGERKERTEWIRIVMFYRLAKIAGEYLRKGSRVYVEGSIRSRKWQDESGQVRYDTEIIAREMQMLDSRNGQHMDSGGDPSYLEAPPSSRPAPQELSAPRGAPMGGFEYFEDF